MDTWRVMLKMRRNGWEFNRLEETERHYMLQKDGNQIPVPKQQRLGKWAVAEILRKAGLLLIPLILAGLSTLPRPGERADLPRSPASSVGSLR